MPCIAVGQSTGTIYATGTKTDCLRKLHEKYPSTKSIRGNYKDYGKSVETVLPETIIIVRNEAKK